VTSSTTVQAHVRLSMCICMQVVLHPILRICGRLYQLQQQQAGHVQHTMCSCWQCERDTCACIRLWVVFCCVLQPCHRLLTCVSPTRLHSTEGWLLLALQRSCLCTAHAVSAGSRCGHILRDLHCTLHTCAGTVTCGVHIIAKLS
jgi:hypothetical protein